MSAPRSVTKSLAGWGNHPVEDCHVYRAERVDELRKIVREAPDSNLIARGSGRAYGDAALNQDLGVVSSERMGRMISFDDETGVLHCEAAVTLAEIIETFLPRGWFFPVTPGSKHVSMGGAVAADVHGKNHHRDGSLGDFLLELNVMVADGQIVTCSRKVEPDLFWATIGGMGLTGIVVDIRIQLKSVDTAYVRALTERAGDLDEALERIIETDRDHAYSVAWVDCLARGRHMGRSVLLRADIAEPSDLPVKHRDEPLRVSPPSNLVVPFPFPSFALNGFSMKAFNTLFYATHRPSRSITNFESYFYPLDAIGHWNRIYGGRGVLQYQIVVPLEESRSAMVKIIDRISSAKCASFLAVLKSMGPEGSGLMSFPRAGTTLSLDFPYTGPDLLRMLHELDEIVLKHNGRVYLAKDACLKAEHVPTMYPDLKQFLAVKNRFDPNERFSSSLSRRLGITSAHG